jgi:hypothetical protein
MNFMLFGLMLWAGGMLAWFMPYFYTKHPIEFKVPEKLIVFSFRIIGCVLIISGFIGDSKINYAPIIVGALLIPFARHVMNTFYYPSSPESKYFSHIMASIAFLGGAVSIILSMLGVKWQ